MKKKPIIYSDLSKKQLENLKGYIQKVDSMSHLEQTICFRDYWSSDKQHNWKRRRNGSLERNFRFFWRGI